MEIAPAFENHDDRKHNTLADLERRGSKVVSLKLNTSNEESFALMSARDNHTQPSDPV
jgi:hypothetical protein